MKLAAVFSVWDDFDLLDYAVNAIRPMVDEIIVAYSQISNYGEKSEWGFPRSECKDLHLFAFEPDLKKQPRENETDKRNFGLKIARELGCTHFLTCDADEFYESEPFLKAKERFLIEPNLAGLVCQCQTYFKSPQLTIGLDTTLVPFIHKLTPTIRHEFNKRYPHSWNGNKILIDPTRSLNINSGVERCDLIMHHYSYVRRDLEKKIRNSTARKNIERSTLREDYANAKEGYFCRYYNKTLVKCDNTFNIPELGIDQP